MATEIMVEGAEELARALANLTDNVRAGILAGALAPAALPVLRAAQAKAPSSPLPPDPPFDLRGSLQIKWGKKGSRIGADADHADVAIGSFGKGGPGEFAYQHGFVELGTAHAPPHPYLRPALDENKDRIVETISRWLRTLLNQAMRGL